MSNSMYYQIGKRDALAEILALGRAKNKKNFGTELMKELAELLLKTDQDNPHAKWWLNHKEI